MSRAKTERVEEHVVKRRITEIVITPEHTRRTGSAEFQKNKERLRADGHFHCWVCGAEQDLQVHHFGIEWSLANIADWEKVKTFCEEWDPYGYGRLLRNHPMDSPDDIRNLLVLCADHHVGVNRASNGNGVGIHELTFPVFLIQKLAQPGVHAVPQTGETIAEARENSAKENSTIENSTRENSKKDDP